MCVIFHLKKTQIQHILKLLDENNAFLLQLYLFLVTYVDQCHMGYCGNTTVG